jgi:all-trans-retinol dehydrogenase (NAD+)
VLVNNAAIQNGGKTLLELEETEIEYLMRVNLLAPINLTRLFLSDLRSSGHIVNVSSCLGLGGLNRMTDYCASKFGLYGFNESLRIELKLRKDIHVTTTVVCPFLVQTGMFNYIRVIHPWLTRPLTPTAVASEILDAIIFRDREEIMLPGFVRFMSFIRLFPCWVYDRSQMLMGSCESFTK